MGCSGGRVGIAAFLTLAAAPAASAGLLDAPYVPESIAMPALRSCAAQGPGFVAVPGSDTCVRLGGRARIEAGTLARAGGARITSTGQLAIDARVQTDYGPARAFVRLRSRQP
jgi:hypothetical protein